MQEDFHYYATYCAAYLAGYTHEESMDICYSAQFVDLCTKTLLSKLGAPQDAATTQLQLELADARTDILGLQDITITAARRHRDARPCRHVGTYLFRRDAFACYKQHHR